MGWDKETKILSHIDSLKLYLKNTHIPFSFSILGYVYGHGYSDNDKYYPIRKLEYGDKVYQEVMVRDPDCDGDDVIISHEFKKGETITLPLEKSYPEE